MTKRYGDGSAAFQALKGVDLDIMAGDFVAVMGPSGSGKSTTMNILGCLDVPTTGSFLFKGVHVEGLNRDQRSLLRRRYPRLRVPGLQPPGPAPRRWRTSNCPWSIAASRARSATTWPWRRSTRWAWPTGTTTPPAELSGGQQQRVAIARAIVTHPDVLLADEPTGNLDSQRSVEIMELLTDLNQVSGITVLMVTHEAEMADFARTIVHFKDGLWRRSWPATNAARG
ncbi:MAG: ABC transporter ATP-binding protein [Caulobacteraceae bacterium]